MNPNDSNQQLPADYLNQIAPKATKHILSLPGLPNLSKKTVIIGVSILLVIIASIALLTNMPNNDKTTEQLAARLVTTESITSSANANIKSTQLLAFNSNLESYLTNTIRDITPILANEGIDISSLDKSIVSSESGSTMTTDLDNARLNAVYDRTYSREMAYKLATVLTLMQQIYESTNNKSLKNFLVNAYKNLEPTQKNFTDFNEADS